MEKLTYLKHLAFMKTYEEIMEWITATLLSYQVCSDITSRIIANAIQLALVKCVNSIVSINFSSDVQGMTLNCIHIFIVTGSFLY